jgi:hypothetical protein
MTLNRDPRIVRDSTKPKKESESEKALDRAVEHKDDILDVGPTKDIETDLARTAERNDGTAKNDLLTKTPLHGNTH